MSLNCKQLKQKYEELLLQRKVFLLELQKAKETGDYTSLKKFRAHWESFLEYFKDHMDSLGDVASFLYSLGKKYNFGIDRLLEVKKGTDGKWLGVVFNTNNSTLIFHGHDLTSVMNNLYLNDVNDINYNPNGEICGRVKLLNNGCLFRGTKTFDTINGKKMKSFDKVFMKEDGTLTGVAKTDDGFYCLFDGEIYTSSIDGRQIEKVESVFLDGEGNLCGLARFVGLGERVFRGNKIIEKFKYNGLFQFGKKYERAFGIHIRPDGQMSGIVDIKGKYHLFIGDNLERELSFELQILDFSDVHTRFLPFDERLGKKQQIQVFGRFKTLRGWYPFEGSGIKKVFGKDEISSCLSVCSLPDGTMAGIVDMGGTTVPFIGGSLIKQIGGKKIFGTDRVIALPDGTIAGSIKLGPFVYKDFIFDGEKYVFVNEINKEEEST